MVLIFWKDQRRQHRWRNCSLLLQINYQQSTWKKQICDSKESITIWCWCEWSPRRSFWPLLFMVPNRDQSDSQVLFQMKLKLVKITKRLKLLEATEGNLDTRVTELKNKIGSFPQDDSPVSIKNHLCTLERGMLDFVSRDFIKKLYHNYGYCLCGFAWFSQWFNSMGNGPQIL